MRSESDEAVARLGPIWLEEADVAERLSELCRNATVELPPDDAKLRKFRKRLLELQLLAKTNFENSKLTRECLPQALLAIHQRKTESVRCAMIAIRECEENVLDARRQIVNQLTASNQTRKGLKAYGK